jgi:hypothetical protein
MKQSWPTRSSRSCSRMRYTRPQTYTEKPAVQHNHQEGIYDSHGCMP